MLANQNRNPQDPTGDEGEQENEGNKKAVLG